MHSTESSQPGEITPLTTAMFIARHRRLLIGLPIVAFGTSILLSYVIGVGFASRSTFVPQPRDGQGSRISALAAQFAVLAGGGSGGSESVEFYAQLLRSRELLTQAVLSDYAIPQSGRDSLRETLVELWNVRGADSAARVRAAADRLDRHLSISTSREANTVTLVARAENPSLAVQINRRLLSLVSEFNLEKRQSRAAAEREFTATRLRDAQRELEEAEAELRTFLEANRQYTASPQLRFEGARLERRVSLRQEVYQSLAQSLEQARIEEVRDTPVVTVVDRPDFYIRPARSRFTDAVVWALLAAIIAMIAAVMRDYVERVRTAGDPDYRALVALVSTWPPWERRIRRAQDQG